MDLQLCSVALAREICVHGAPTDTPTVAPWHGAPTDTPTDKRATEPNWRATKLGYKPSFEA